MAVAFRAFAELTGGNRANSTVSKPTGTVDDDILIGALTLPEATTPTAPAGWTEYAAGPKTWHTNQHMHLYWKRASSEGANWTWTHSAAVTWAFVAAYSGAITSVDPNDVTATANSGGTDKNVIATGVTIATDQSLGIIVWTNWTNTGGQTPPSGFTEHGAPNNTFGAEDKLLGTGATGNQTTVLVNNDDWVAFFLALKPPGAAGGDHPTRQRWGGVPFMGYKPQGRTW